MCIKVAHTSGGIFCFVTILILFFALSPLFAQDFGKNKVQYEDFEFKILETDHFDIYHYDSESEAVGYITPVIERWYKRLSPLFKSSFKKNQPIVLYANHPDFQQTNIIPSFLSQGIGGVTESRRNRVIIPLSGINSENNHVLGHEMVHAFHFALAATIPSQYGVQSNLPLWFVEGLAEYLSLGREHAQTAMWLRDAVIHEYLPSIGQLSRNQQYSPYRFGHALWAYIAGRWGDEMITELFTNSVKIGWRTTARELLGIKSSELSKQWREDTQEWVQAQLTSEKKLPEVTEQIIPSKGGTDISPIISPDGDKLAFFSQRNVFSLDLFIADTRTGNIIRKITSTNTNKHFDSLRFMDSAGTWSPDGTQFAFVVVEEGDNALAIYDLDKRKIVHTARFEEAAAITNLAWSPDGERVAFSGLSGGKGDLYLYTLSSEELTQLTDDFYTDIQPAWSPDGKTLAFVTDRGWGTDLSLYEYRAMQLGFFHLEENRIELLSFSQEAKHINPQYAPDGESIYFIANFDGFSDIYRYSFTDRKLYRITEVKTGVSGLTKLSPAFSVARESGEIAYNLFKNRQHLVYGISDPRTRGIRVDIQTEHLPTASERTRTTISLPPQTEKQDVVARYLGQPVPGLPEEKDYPTREYQPALSLASIGGLSAGMTIDSFGLNLFASAYFVFDDFLSNHVVSTYLYLTETWKDITATAQYLNRKHRVNWGVSAQHISSKSVETTTEEETKGEGEKKTTILEITQLRERIFTDRITFLTEYPLSLNLRFEFATGYTRVGFDREEEVITLVDNEVKTRTTTNLDEHAPLHLSHNQLAFVGDYSFNGFTGPLKGSRFRIEADPFFGTLNFVELYGDYRKYFFAKPVSFDLRVLHRGRYLGNAEDSILSPLSIAGGTLVRGYSPYTFSDKELSSPAFERLFGSRILAFNAEIRLPIIGSRQLGFINFPYVPVTLVGFFDAGWAWTSSDPPYPEIASRSKERIPVFSAGTGVRINLLGLLITHVYVAFPFQRPEQTAIVGFNFAPGW